MPALPDEEAFVYDGPSGAGGRDAAFLVHARRIAHAGSCLPIPNVQDEINIRWRLVVHAHDAAPTAFASFWAPHIGCPDPERVAFWRNLHCSIERVRHEAPGADIVLAGDSNLWIPGLVSNRPARPAERASVALLHHTLATYGLVICNPAECPTHRAGAALDLVIASPGIVAEVQVHNGWNCCCPDRNCCCPLLGSDHYALSVTLAKPRATLPADAALPGPRVRDWRTLLESQVQPLQHWASLVDDSLQGAAHTAVENRRPILDALYARLLATLWDADPSLYRWPRGNSQRQPSWWTNECYQALVARNAAWRERRRSPSGATESAFRTARNRFHHIARTAKNMFWSRWLDELSCLQGPAPREAARRVRQRFRRQACSVAPSLTPVSAEEPAAQRACMHDWAQHFQHAADAADSDFSPRHFARVGRRIRRLRERPNLTSHLSDVAFSEAELRCALRSCSPGRAPGCDNLPYEALHVDIRWWKQAIMRFLELCRLFACIPSVWKRGIVVPLHKGGSARERDNYRPITLTCSFAKLLERMVLNRIQPLIDPMLDSAQAGYRWGADVQIYSLLEVLRLRGRRRTWCAFLDLRKAFDVAWRDAALLRLWRAGVGGGLWHLIDDFVTGRSASVRVASFSSDAWDVDDGLGQGAVLSGLLFNVLINGLAAAIRRACNGVRAGSCGNAPLVKLFMYADDVVILADDPADLQNALNAAATWAQEWRFQFGVGCTKSAVMCFNPPPASHHDFTLNNRPLHTVDTYRYLGVILHNRMRWQPHFDHILARGEQRMAACLSWATTAALPVAWLDTVFSSYVLSSALYGIEHAASSPALARMQTRLLQWGRRLLMWPAGAPGAAVAGQLGWMDAQALQLVRSASLAARLLSMTGSTRRPCLPARISSFAQSQPSSWLASVRNLLQQAGVPNAESWAVGPGASTNMIRRWITHAVTPAARRCSVERTCRAACASQSTCDYLRIQPTPALNTCVYGRYTDTTDARDWGLARCGHHPFANGRSARHRAICSSVNCRFCGQSEDSLEHALLTCTAQADLRSRWSHHCSVGRNGLTIRLLFSTDRALCTARDVANNVAFVARVCQRAEACILTS
jgi:hypothetical protein